MFEISENETKQKGEIMSLLWLSTQNGLAQFRLLD